MPNFSTLKINTKLDFQFKAITATLILRGVQSLISEKARLKVK